MDIAKSVVNSVDKSAKYALGNPYLMAIVKITLALYATQIAPKLPATAYEYLNNTYVKIIALLILVYVSEKDFQLAVIFAVAFVIGINMISGRGPLESFADFSKEYTPAGTQKLIEPNTMIYPGCDKLTMADLEKAFDGDRHALITKANYAFHDLFESYKSTPAKETLMKIAYAAGLPYNRDFTDEHAPYIGSILMYQGMNISSTCTPPQ
uniref:Uncharacterized protein n=1 Tax=viral metagenome TaxID=1070528 RepID=A0A6C0E0I9_9ZZZZ